MSSTVVGWLFSFLAMAFNPVKESIKISYKEIENYDCDVFHKKDISRPVKLLMGWFDLVREDHESLL